MKRSVGLLIIAILFANIANAAIIDVPSGNTIHISETEETSNLSDSFLDVDSNATVYYTHPNRNFENNAYASDFIRSRGKVLFCSDGSYNCESNISFLGNYGYGPSQGNLIYADNNGQVIFGQNTKFEGNYAEGESLILAQNQTPPASDDDASIIFGNNTIFEGNYSTGPSGAIRFYDWGSATFYGTTVFRGNSGNEAGAIRMDSNASGYSVLNFKTYEKDQYILFEDNMNLSGPNSINSFINGSTETSQINFKLIEGSYASIRDPIASDGNQLAINLSGGLDGSSGSLYLWGPNDKYYGFLNINSGGLYISEHESLGGFSIANVDSINFASGSMFRPQFDSGFNLAQLPTGAGQVNVTGTVDLVPAGISGLEIGDYQFLSTSPYTSFSGWESDFAKLTINDGMTIDYTFKRDLEGYNGLTSAADDFRRNPGTLMGREMVDNIYHTGTIPQEFIDLFGSGGGGGGGSGSVSEGSEYLSFSSVHRANTRQFIRQVESRTKNKDCIKCGVENGYKDNHFWINFSANQIDKDNSRNALGYEYNPNAIAFGVDHDFIPNKLNFGIALHYGDGKAKSKTPRTIKSDNDLNTYLVGFYGKYKHNRYYATGMIGGGIIENNTKLTSALIINRGEFTTKSGFANIETGYDVGNPCYRFKFEPHIGIDYTYLYNEAHDEKGTQPRHLDSLKWNIFEIPVGLRVAKDMNYKGFIFSPTVDITYARNFGDKGVGTRGNFIGSTTIWNISSSDSRDVFRGSLNLKANSLEYPFAMNLGYVTDYMKDYTDQQFYLTIRYDF